MMRARWDGLEKAVLHHARTASRGAGVRVMGATDLTLSYEELWSRACVMRSGLEKVGARRGDVIAVAMATTIDVVIATIAISMIGAVLVPLQPPSRLVRSSDGWNRLVGAIAAARPSVILCSMRELLTVSEMIGDLQCKAICLERLLAESGGEAGHISFPPDDLAMIQFSSGSTGNPKGVCLTRGNLVTNLEAIVERTEWRPEDVALSWLPLYHDLGLVSVLMSCLWAGSSVILYNPSTFVRNPLGWLRLAGQVRATMTAAPQFAYALCLAKIETDRRVLDGIDLRAMRWMFNGSEFVHWETCARFMQLLSSCGIPQNALQPGYGLAENCVGVTLRRPMTPVKLARLPCGFAALQCDDDQRFVTLAGNGTALRGTEIRICSESGCELPLGTVGEIQIRGASATAKYLLADGRELSAAVGGWLSTGDLGTFIDGELFVVGRSKEIIKSGGRMICPPDVEASLAAALGLSSDGIAICSFYEGLNGSESVIAVLELPRSQTAMSCEGLTDSVRRHVLREFKLQVAEVYITCRGKLPRTSSGKIRRSYLSEMASTSALSAFLQDTRQRVCTLT